VSAGETRTISWYHITDYPGTGNPTDNVARWAGRLDSLDDTVQATDLPIATRERYNASNPD